MSRCEINGDECDCSCHEPGSGTMHCFPCCGTCPHCGRPRMVDAHELQCPQRPKPKCNQCGDDGEFWRGDELVTCSCKLPTPCGMCSGSGAFYDVFLKQSFPCPCKEPQS